MDLTVRSSASRLLNWWLTELSDVWQQVRPQPARGLAPNLVINPAGDRVRILAESRRERREIAAVPADSKEFEAAIQAALADHPKWNIGLRIPTRDCLIRRVVIPWQARRNIPALLRLDLESASPLRLESVLHAHMPVTQADVEGNNVNIRQLVIKRDKIDPFREILAKYRAQLAWIDAWDEAAEKPLGINFLSEDTGEWSAHAEMTRKNWAPMVLSALLLLTASGIWTYRQDSALQDLRTKIAGLQREVAAIRSQVEAENSLAARAAVIEAEELHSLAPLQTLELLSQEIGSDTWLSQLDIDRSQASMTGYSSAAAELLTKLAANKELASVAFTAPVVYESAANKERFSLRIELHGTPPSAQQRGEAGQGVPGSEP